MRLLLDTNVFLWLQAAPERLGEHLGLMENPENDLLVSAATSWEIAIKVGLGRLQLPEEPRHYVPTRMKVIGAEPVPIQHSHALAVSELPPHHRDPFDRLLVAQASELSLTIVTADRQLAAYEVETILV